MTIYISKLLIDKKNYKNTKRIKHTSPRPTKTATLAHITSAAGKDVPVLFFGVQCLHILQGTVSSSREVSITSGEQVKYT